MTKTPALLVRERLCSRENHVLRANREQTSRIVADVFSVDIVQGIYQRCSSGVVSRVLVLSSGLS